MWDIGTSPSERAGDLCGTVAGGGLAHVLSKIPGV